MIKEFYINNLLRCSVEQTKVDELHLYLEELRHWWFIRYWTKVDRGFYVRPYAFQENTIRSNPQYGGNIEMYVDGTFNLVKRINKYAADYQTACDYSEEIKKLIYDKGNQSW